MAFGRDRPPLGKTLSTYFVECYCGGLNNGSLPANQAIDHRSLFDTKTGVAPVFLSNCLNLVRPRGEIVEEPLPLVVCNCQGFPLWSFDTQRHPRLRLPVCSDYMASRS